MGRYIVALLCLCTISVFSGCGVPGQDEVQTIEVTTDVDVATEAFPSASPESEEGEGLEEEFV